MVENFLAFNPVSLHFGKNIVSQLPKILKKYGNRILFIYGKNSIKKYGYYDEIMKVLSDFEVIEYHGIKPNPIIKDVREAVKLGKENKVEIVLAIGGGSVIDTAKVVSVALAHDFDAWDFVSGKTKAKAAIPLVSVLTLAATGTEMNGAAVIQNPETNEKIGLFSPYMYPKHSFVDPQYTYTVSPEYTAYATADIIAHALEAYFGAGEPEVTDYIIFGVIKTAMKYGKMAMENPKDYEIRANHTLASTLALNGITNYGKKGGDWGVHDIGHNFSLAFDTPHGASLSLTYPAWLKYHADKIPQRIIKLGDNLWGLNTVKETILEFEKFFTSISCPIRLKDLSLTENQIERVRKLLIKNKATGANHLLNADALNKIVDFMY